MPFLDVSELMSDPDLADNFSVVSTSMSMATGEPVSTAAAPVNAIGVVIPGDSSLLRRDDGSRLIAFINIYTRYPLSNGVKQSDIISRQADIVTWRARQYTVIMIEDYSDFGLGFIHAQADLLTLNPSS